MKHRTIRRGKVRNKFGMVHFNVGHEGRAGLRYRQWRIYRLHVGKIRLDRKFRAETYIKYGFNSQGFEEAVHLEVGIFETRGHGGGHNSNDWNAVFQVFYEKLEVVNTDTGVVGTGADTFAATDTQFSVMVYYSPGAVIAHLHGADPDTSMAINAFLLYHFDNWTQSFTLHKISFFAKVSPK
jgi:hypothetical protein